MFTVLIISEQARSNYERYRTLFGPYIDANVLAICEWRKSLDVGDLESAVPGLNEILVGRREWRAVVVDFVADHQAGMDETDPDNPFDFLDNLGLDPASGRPREQLNLAPSPHSIIRLSHLLLGYPDLSAKAFLPDPSFRDPSTGERVYLSAIRAQAEAAGLDIEATEHQFLLELGKHWDPQVHYHEVPYSEAEQAIYGQLASAYRPSRARPSEVIFVAARQPKPDNPAHELRRAWGQFSDQGVSRFVERNDYPASCRFVIYERSRDEQAQSYFVEMQLWLSVLCLAANDLPPSALQADRLYRLGVTIDEDALEHVLNIHLSQLASARDDLDAEVRRPQRGEPAPITEILPQENIQVVFNQSRSAGLKVLFSGYGLSTDCPRNELVRWSDNVVELRSASETFIREPRRALSRTVTQTRHQTRSYLNTDVALDEITRMELIDELTKRSRRLAESSTADILDRDKLRRIIDEGDARIRRAISGRMNRKTVILSSLVALVAWGIGFSPYLIQASQLDAVTFAESVLVFLWVLGAIAGVGVLALLSFRRKLQLLLHSIQDELQAFTMNVNSGAAEFGKYLTDVVAYMRGQAALVATERKFAQQSLHRSRMAIARDSLQKHIELEKSIIRDIGKSMEIERGVEHGLELSAGNVSRLTQLLYLPRSKRRALLNNSGETIEAPYDFVTRLNLSQLIVAEPRAKDMNDGGAEQHA